MFCFISSTHFFYLILFYVPCIYIHARWELPLVTQVFVVVLVLCILRPPWSQLLAPRVFKPSCSTPFTPFLCLVSTSLSPIFHSKNSLHDTSVFSSFLAADFCLTSHSLVFVCITTLLYGVLLPLCSCLQTQCVCHVLHPMSGEDGILVAEVSCGVHPTGFFGLDFS